MTTKNHSDFMIESHGHQRCRRHWRRRVDRLSDRPPAEVRTMGTMVNEAKSTGNIKRGFNGFNVVNNGSQWLMMMMMMNG